MSYAAFTILNLDSTPRGHKSGGGWGRAHACSLLQTAGNVCSPQTDLSSLGWAVLFLLVVDDSSHRTSLR